MNRDSSFLLAGPVYENGVRMKGYSHYDKFIKSGKLLFVYSLTYPDDYKPAMSKLFHLIETGNRRGILMFFGNKMSYTQKTLYICNS